VRQLLFKIYVGCLCLIVGFVQVGLVLLLLFILVCIKLIVMLILIYVVMFALTFVSVIVCIINVFKHMAWLCVVN